MYYINEHIGLSEFYARQLHHERLISTKVEQHK